VTLDDDMAGFIQQGLAIHIGTRNERLEPNGARVAAVTVDDDRQHVVAYVPAVSAPRVLRDLEANGQGALAFARPVDDRASQVKGAYVESWTATESERQVVDAQIQGAIGQLEAVGIPRSAMVNWAMWPCVAIRLRVNAVFDQTPGPKAGAALP
jgi:hypothetical protein